MTLHPHEAATVRAFMTAPKRDRFLQLLANPKRRQRLLNELNHFKDWDERYATRLPSSAGVESIVAVLEAAGAPALCHVVSDDPDLDATDLPLREAVDRAEVFDFASLLCCVAGRLAFFFDESWIDRPRLLLRRPSTAG